MRCVLFVLVLSLASPVYAQVEPIVIEGKVTWINQTPAAGVEVDVISENDEDVFVSVLTDENGLYRIEWTKVRLLPSLVVATSFTMIKGWEEVEAAHAEPYRGERRIDFVLTKTGPARLYGKVSPLSLAGTSISLMSTKFPNVIVRSQHVDKSGFYAIEVPPGEYIVWAFDGLASYEGGVTLLFQEGKYFDILLKPNNPN